MFFGHLLDTAQLFTQTPNRHYPVGRSIRDDKLGEGVIERWEWNGRSWDLTVKFHSGEQLTTTCGAAAARMEVTGWKPERRVIVANRSAVRAPYVLEALARLADAADIIIFRPGSFRDYTIDSQDANEQSPSPGSEDAFVHFAGVVARAAGASGLRSEALAQDDGTLARLNLAGIAALRASPAGNLHSATLDSQPLLDSEHAALVCLWPRLEGLLRDWTSPDEGLSPKEAFHPGAPPPKLDTATFLNRMCRLDHRDAQEPDLQRVLQTALRELLAGNIRGCAYSARQVPRAAPQGQGACWIQLQGLIAVCQASMGEWDAFDSTVWTLINAPWSGQMSGLASTLAAALVLTRRPHVRDVVGRLTNRQRRWQLEQEALQAKARKDLEQRARLEREREQARRAEAAKQAEAEREREVNRQAEEERQAAADRRRVEGQRTEEEVELAKLPENQRSAWRIRFQEVRAQSSQADRDCKALFWRRHPVPAQPLLAWRSDVSFLSPSGHSSRGPFWSESMVRYFYQVPKAPTKVVPLSPIEDLLLDRWLELHPDFERQELGAP